MVESVRGPQRRRLVSAVVGGAVSVALFVASGCAVPRFGSKAPISEQGTHTLRLWQGFFIAAMVVGAIVLGLIAFVIVRYRRRDDEVPTQKADNLRVEALYTALPILTVVVLFAFSMGIERIVTRTDPKPDLVVEVTSYQWGWRFEYPDRSVTIEGSGIEHPPILVLPQGKTARLRLHSLDVIHSFWVPSLLQKRDMIPGRVNTMDVTPTHTGRFDGKCAEYCSLDHARMIFTLEVVRPADFAAALVSARQEVAG